MGKFLHDLAWSLHQGKLHELFLHDGITFATWGLVLATLILVVYSWQASREQRKRWIREDELRKQDRSEERARWKREDQIRREEQMPRFRFGLEYRERDCRVFLWCANLGLSTFQVDRVYAMYVSDLDEKELYTAGFSPQTVVRSGERVDIAIPNELLEQVFFTADFEFRVSVISANTSSISDPQVYSFFAADKGVVAKMDSGFNDSRKVLCEKCGATGFFDPKGIESRQILLDALSRAKMEISASCPNHSSTLLRSIVELDGRTKRFVQAS